MANSLAGATSAARHRTAYLEEKLRVSPSVLLCCCAQPAEVRQLSTIYYLLAVHSITLYLLLFDQKILLSPPAGCAIAGGNAHHVTNPSA
jgi:hypothetical protein